MEDVGLYIMYALFVIAVVSAIGLPIANLAKAPGGAVKSLYGIVALVVVFGIAYAVSDSTVQPQWAALGVTPGAVKLVGAGLIVFYVAMVVAIVGLIYSEINKALN